MNIITIKKISSLVAVLALGLSLTPLTAQAGSASFVLTPQATLSGICLIGVTNISFGSIPAGATNLSSSAQLSVLCTKNTTYSWEVLFSGSDYAAGQAHMVGATYGDSINYGAYKSDGTSFSGNSVASDYVYGTGTGLIQTYSIIGKIASVPYVHPDSYSDTISVSLRY
jgi:spore coat protein U-like protein